MPDIGSEQLPRLTTGVDVVNDWTKKQVIDGIKEAKSKGWRLFPPEQLSVNAEEWRASLEMVTRNRPPEWLSHAQEAVSDIPLVHVINPSFLPHLIDSGHILSLSTREEARGRTSDYEKELGLGDYVFLSYPNWRTITSGSELYFKPFPILEQTDTVVSLFDILILSGYKFDDRIELYQKSTFNGSDFKDLLPYFLVVKFGDVRNPYEQSVTDGYPQWFIERTGRAFFQPEIKAKDKLDVPDDVKIYFEERHRGIDLDRNLTDEEISQIQAFFGNRIVPRLPGRIDKVIETSKEWSQ